MAMFSEGQTVYWSDHNLVNRSGVFAGMEDGCFARIEGLGTTRGMHHIAVRFLDDQPSLISTHESTL